MVSVPYSRLPRAQADWLLREQRKYSAGQILMAMESRVLVWVRPLNRGLRPSIRAAVWDRDGPDCAYCGCGLTVKTFTVDHVTPLARGGLTELENLTVACRPCNSSKRDG